MVPGIGVDGVQGILQLQGDTQADSLTSWEFELELLRDPLAVAFAYL